MKFYHIKDNYIMFLHQYDPVVADNKREKRPYIGILLDIDGIRYYAPLTSPKPKHLSMKNGKDFRKIGQGQYGAINFNNMIPVPDSALIPFDFQSEPDRHYKRLLQNQYNAIKSDEKAILQTAQRLRALLISDNDSLSPYDRQVKARCCNLSLLETVYRQYDCVMLTP